MTTKESRTVIRAVTPSHVEIRYTDFVGDRHELDIYAPSDGGYVRDGEGKQFCKGLSRRGAALDWPGPGTIPFIDYIRREWEAAKRYERKTYGKAKS